jgi:hypothetical protein
MKRKWLVISAFVFLILLSPILFRKRTVWLMSNGEVVAIAKRSSLPDWDDGAVRVYQGKELFGLWADLFNFPLYIYPFSDLRRFLCVYDDDTSVLVFVVDFRVSDTDAPTLSKWPSDDYVRTYMAQRATNIVIETGGLVRLPNDSELQEVSSNLMSLTSLQFKTTSFPSGDFGIYRFYWTKEDLLSELATNRNSVWP